MKKEFKQSIRIHGAYLEGQKRLDIALTGLHGIGRSKALELSLAIAKIEKAIGDDALGKIPKLSELNPQQIDDLNQELAKLEIEERLRDSERRQNLERESLGKAVKKANHQPAKA